MKKCLLSDGQKNTCISMMLLLRCAGQVFRNYQKNYRLLLVMRQRSQNLNICNMMGSDFALLLATITLFLDNFVSLVKIYRMVTYSACDLQ